MEHKKEPLNAEDSEKITATVNLLIDHLNKFDINSINTILIHVVASFIDALDDSSKLDMFIEQLKCCFKEMKYRD